MSPKDLQDRRERAKAANALLQTIADNGRRFFRTGDRVASLEVDDRGRVWFHDDYKGRRIYTHRGGRWKGFSHGGTMRSLVQRLRDFVMRGTPIGWGTHFGPWPDQYCGGDLWGYGEEMEHVREAAVRLGILKEAEVAP